MSKSKFYKHPVHKHVYGTTLPTPICRAAFVSLVTPREPMAPKPGQAAALPRYEISLILDPQDPKTIAWCKEVKAMTKEMVELFNEGRPAKLGECPIAKDGNEFEEEKYPFFQNKIVVVGRNVAKPEVYNAEMQLADASIITGGNLVKAVVTPMVTAHGISYKLMKIRFIKDDGTKFAGGVNNAAVVAMLGDDESEASAAATKQLADEEVETETAAEEAAVVETPAPEVKKTKATAKAGKGKIVDLL